VRESRVSKERGIEIGGKETGVGERGGSGESGHVQIRGEGVKKKEGEIWGSDLTNGTAESKKASVRGGE